MSSFHAPPLPQAAASSKRYVHISHGTEDKFNSVAQLLFHVKPLRRYFLGSGSIGKVHAIFSKLFKQLISNESTKASAKLTTELIRGNAQSEMIIQDLLRDEPIKTAGKEDAQKYLERVLRTVIDEAFTSEAVPTSGKPPFDDQEDGALAWDYFSKFMHNDFVSYLLTVQFLGKWSYPKCGHRELKWNFETEIQVNPEEDVPNPQKIYPLAHYLRQFMTQNETIDQCSKCGLSQLCTEVFFMKRFPPYLMIYLNRFPPMQDKVNRWVHIDERLELLHQAYELVSAIIHKGTVQNGIHWTVVRERPDYWVVMTNEGIIKGLDSARAHELLTRYALVMVYKRVEDNNVNLNDLADHFASALNLSTVPVSNVQPRNVAQLGPKHPYCGLVNKHNVCYSNSILQALYTLTHVRQYLLSHSRSGHFHYQLAALYTAMQVNSASNYRVIDPEFKYNQEFRIIRPEFICGQMHDAHEYMTILIDLVHQEVNQAKRNPRPRVQPEMFSAEQAWDYHVAYYDNSHLSNLFMGQMESVKSCNGCGSTSNMWCSPWELSLDLKIKADNGMKVINLVDCIEDFTSADTLTDCSPCESCQSCNSFSKQQFFIRLPTYLVIQLKRFTDMGTKNCRPVRIVEQLNLSGQLYQLSSVVCHVGSVDRGHYYTIVREDGQWVDLDDESIRLNITSNQAHSLIDQNAYLCIFEAVQ